MTKHSHAINLIEREIRELDKELAIMQAKIQALKEVQIELKATHQMLTSLNGGLR